MQHPTYCIHTGQPSGGDTEVTQDLITPTAKIHSRRPPASLYKGRMAHMPPPQAGPAAACLSFLPSSFPLQALPCSYHMQKSHVAFFSQGRPLGVAVSREQGQLMPLPAKLPTSWALARPGTLPASPAHEGLAASKKKGLLSLIQQGS